MDATRIVLAGGWVSLMLVYLLGDVLRLFAGDHVPGQIDGRPASGGMWTLAAVIMLVPIAMILISLLVPAGPLRWISIIVSIAVVLFNLAGLPYPGFYDNLLIVVSFAINGIIIWQAWAWDLTTA